MNLSYKNTSEEALQPTIESLPFGTPIPENSPHAVSVHMPQWEDIIAYEEHTEEASDAVLQGYPRFVIHPWMHQWTKKFIKAKHLFALPFPNLFSARQGKKFLNDQGVETCHIFKSSHDIYLLAANKIHKDKITKFWQNYGWVVSSRQIQSFNKNLLFFNQDSTDQLNKTLARIWKIASSHVLTFPSGMAAYDIAFQAIGTLSPHPAALLGFSYTDSIEQHKHRGSIIWDDISAKGLKSFELSLKSNPVSSVFLEYPSNPLLLRADIKKIALICKRNKIPFIVDTSMDATEQFKVLPYADIIVTSLTKMTSGSGEVMGGACILNSKSTWYSSIVKFIQQNDFPVLWHEDAKHILNQLESWVRRTHILKQSARTVFNWLKNHPQIEQIYPTDLSEVKGIISIVLKNKAQQTPTFYNALPFAKGPGFGIGSTLICPYTMLAHYSELDELNNRGISEYLLRISTGYEPAAEIIDGLKVAFEAIK